MGDDERWVHVGPSVPLPKVDAPLGLRLYRSLTQKSIDPLLINAETGASLSSAEVLQRGISFATELRSRGIRPGDVVSLALENCMEFCFMMLGTFMAGAILAPVDPNLDSNDLGHIFRMLDAKILFALPRRSDIIRENKPDHTELVDVNYEDANWRKFISHTNVINFEPTIVESLDAPAMILCSSGTTGLPKGVMVSHNTFLIPREMNWLKLGDGPKPITCMTTPIFWASGATITLSTLDSCDKQVFLPKFDVDIFLRAVEKYKITSLILSPQQVGAIVKSSTSTKYDVSSIGPIICGGAPLSLIVKEEGEKILKTRIMMYYGQTEAMYPFLIHGPKNPEKPGSVGMIGPNCSVKVADFETSRALGPNKEGEICVKFPLPFLGYYNNPEAIKSVVDSEGWHHTGDVGHYDDDGYFFVYDRIKELIKYKGVHISAVDIELVLQSHPQVRDAGVAGVFHDIDQERPVGFVVKQPGAAVTKEELLQHVKEQLPEYKQLHGGLHFVNEIPRTPSGKIMRRKLRLQAAELSE